jgi:hypothetical protein
VFALVNSRNVTDMVNLSATAKARLMAAIAVPARNHAADLQPSRESLLAYDEAQVPMMSLPTATAAG